MAETYLDRWIEARLGVRPDQHVRNDARSLGGIPRAKGIGFEQVLGAPAASAALMVFLLISTSMRATAPPAKAIELAFCMAILPD